MVTRILIDIASDLLERCLAANPAEKNGNLVSLRA
jgi:hypothetical protein